MIIASMNVCGLSELEKQNNLIPFLMSQATIVMLQETRFKKSSQASDLARKHNVNCYAHSSSMGNYSGAFMEKSSDNFIKSDSYQEAGSGNCIQLCEIQYGSLCLGLINVHGPHLYRDFQTFVRDLEEAILSLFNKHLPILVIGDFNVEYRNPQLNDRSKKNQLSKLFNRYDIQFPAHLDHGHTRMSGRQIDLVFSSRCLVNQILSIEAVFTVHSDHALIKVELARQQVVPQKIWKLNKELLKHEETKLYLEKRIRNILHSPTLEDWYRVKAVVKNRYHSRGIVEAKRKREKLERLQRSYNMACHNMPINKQQVSQYGQQIKEHEKAEYEAARIRTRQQWIEEGEQPTKYFLGLEKTRNAQASMSAVKKVSDGQLTTDPVEIQDQVRKFYAQLYDQRPVDKIEQRRYLRFTPVLNSEQISLLDKPITVNEIKDAILVTGMEKSPGVDGLTYEFYKVYIDSVAPILTRIYNDLPTSSELPRDFGMSLLILLYKKGDPKDIANWRPISLQNTDEKILSRVLAARLAVVCAQVLGKEQSGFIPGRETSDVILHTQCVQRLLTKKKQGGYIALLDFEKAYDSVDHDFLMRILHRMDGGGFFTSVIQ